MSVAKEDADVLEIDRDNLHVEWLRQAKVFGEWAAKLADKKGELDIVESRLDVVVAELDRSIRSHPDRYDIVKVSEDAIKKTILLQEAHQKATARVNRVRHEVAVIDAYVKALDHKKKALENLVVLWMNDYFAEPHVSRGKMTDAASEKFDMERKRALRHGKK
jgi:hypothetical protein